MTSPDLHTRLTALRDELQARADAQQPGAEYDRVTAGIWRTYEECAEKLDAILASLPAEQEPQHRLGCDNTACELCYGFEGAHAKTDEPRHQQALIASLESVYREMGTVGSVLGRKAELTHDEIAQVQMVSKWQGPVWDAVLALRPLLDAAPATGEQGFFDKGHPFQTCSRCGVVLPCHAHPAEQPTKVQAPMCPICEGKGRLSPDDAECGIQANGELFTAGYEPGEAPHATREDGWQPIETAPRDGAPIIAYQPGGVFGDGIAFPASVGLAYWRSADALNPEGWYGPSSPKDYPTHWQPLPASPRREEP